MNNIEVSKAAGIDKFSGRFLNDNAKVLAEPNQSFLCNLSISLGVFPDAGKLAKQKPLFQKGLNLNL